MDNLSHTLVGAALAEAGLKRWTPLATATLLIGANLPDVDGVAMLVGRDAALLVRRGWTHGLLAMLLLPWVLAGVMLLWDRYVRRRRQPDAPPARPWALVGLAWISILTHPALDWLNTYGVRLLMPFDGTWFYGDTLFIIDPWLWLLMAAAAVLTRSRSPRGIAGWLFLGAVTSALVLTPDVVLPSAKVAWSVGLALLLGLRLRGATAPRAEHLAIACGVVLLLYVGGMRAGSRLAEHQAAAWLRAQGLAVERTVAGPLPAWPFARDVIALTPGRYHFVAVDWLGGERFRFSGPSLPREAPGPIVQAALESPQVRGFRNWMRLPTWQVEETEAGWRVVLLDVRYARTSGEAGIGTAVVELDRALRPR